VPTDDQLLLFFKAYSNNNETEEGVGPDEILKLCSDLAIDPTDVTLPGVSVVLTKEDYIAASVLWFAGAEVAIFF
jgi:hypothetical protein